MEKPVEDNDAEQHDHAVRQAKEQMAAKDFAGAVVTLDAALELDPDNEVIKALRDEAARKAAALELQKQGEEALASGDNAKAVELLLQALASDPDNASIKEEEVLAEKRRVLNCNFTVKGVGP